MTSFLKHLGGHTGRIVLALVFALPLVFMLVSSFKPDDQIFGDLDSCAPSCRSAPCRWTTTQLCSSESRQHGSC